MKQIHLKGKKDFKKFKYFVITIIFIISTLLTFNYLNENIYDYNTKEFNVENFNFEIIHNPGHTSDSVTFYFKEENVMFVGDFIFKETIGRTDLETGNMIEMQKSINMIKKYDDNIFSSLRFSVCI